ncbi:MAG: NUDIX hydrolase [Bryobacteraceae bacterium]|nr:NUDIX hydrolase [Bryobacteraceae bacterium]
MNGRTLLLAALRAHSPWDAREASMLARIAAFVETHENCFERTLLEGHVTGSAWVVNPERTHALLVHHRRLDRWLQPGGHCDGSPDVLGTALREVLEETGIHARPVSEAIFDVDAHDIPARGAEPAHVHYDIRYLAEAPLSCQPVVSPESREVRWVPLEEIARLGTDASVLRLVEKTLAWNRRCG